MPVGRRLASRALLRAGRPSRAAHRRAGRGAVALALDLLRSMSSKRLIVNADDLGRTAGINQGIVDAHRRGIVTSATLMVNYAPAAEAAALAREHPGLGIGLHVALTGGPPALPPERLPEPGGRRGASCPPSPTASARAKPDEVLAEARAQLAPLPRDHEARPHALRQPPSLAPHAGGAGGARHAGVGDGPARARASPEMRERLRRENVPTTDAFVEDFFDETVPLEALLAHRRRGPLGTTELMCHPAVVDDELRTTSGYADMRAKRAGGAHAPRGPSGGAGPGHQAHPLRRADGVDRGSFRERAPVRSRPTGRARPSACRT